MWPLGSAGGVLRCTGAPHDQITLIQQNGDRSKRKFCCFTNTYSVIKIGFGFDLFENIGKLPLVMKYLIAKTHLFFLKTSFPNLEYMLSSL